MANQAETTPHNLKILHAFMSFSNDLNTEAVFDIANGLRETDLYDDFIRYAHSQSSVSQMIQERYFAPIINLNDLLKCPQNSLGYHYASAMIRENLQPVFYPNIGIEEDYSYIAMRMRQTHDIWHTITGFGTDPAGEAGLQAFTMAQMRSPLAIALLGGLLVNALKSSSSLHPLFEKIQQGWLMGETALPFLAEKWEDSWFRPLSEWRTALKVDYVE
jgi:ubiquinone biosynthesis protein COQ4